jgi:hypothetical protein
VWAARTRITGTARLLTQNAVMLAPSLAFGLVAVTTIAATALGTWILGARFRFDHSAFRWAVRTATGFLVVSAVAVLVVCGFAGEHAPFSTVRGARLDRVRLDRSECAARHGALPATSGEGRTHDQNVGAWRWIGIAAAVAYSSWIFLCASLPPVAVDELNHHLAVPRKILEEGGSVLFLDNIYAYFPAFGEMLFLLGLGVAGELAARLFHAVFGLVVTLAIYGFSRRYLSIREASWSVAVFLSVPSVMVILPWAYVDLMFTAFAFVAVALLIEFFDTRQIKWVMLSGVMAGGALATKYTGLQLVLLLVLLVFVEHVTSRPKTFPIAALVLAAVASAIVAPYLWRNWQQTGWPLFPFPLGPFGLRPEINWDADRADLFLTMLASYGSSAIPIGPAGLWDSLVAPAFVFQRALQRSPVGCDGVVGPVFLLTPLLSGAAPRDTASGCLSCSR